MPVFVHLDDVRRTVTPSKHTHTYDVVKRTDRVCNICDREVVRCASEQRTTDLNDGVDRTEETRNSGSGSLGRLDRKVLSAGGEYMDGVGSVYAERRESDDCGEALTELLLAPLDEYLLLGLGNAKYAYRLRSRGEVSAI